MGMMYTLGYPLVTAVLLYRYRRACFNDQLLRAQDKGSTRRENRWYDTRKKFSKLYYQFKPHKFYWVVMIIVRKAMIALTSLMFKKNPSFQLSVSLLIMFTCYAMQVLNRPYMSMSERPEVIRFAAERGELPAVNPSVVKAKKIREQRMRRQGWKFDTHAHEKPSVRKLIRKGKIEYFFNYNTVETTLLGSAVLINLAGVMFSSARMQESYYEGQQEAITYCAIMIIVLTLLYYFVVCAAELGAGSDWMQWIQHNLCCCICPDKERRRRKNKEKLRKQGLVHHDEDEIDEDVEMAMAQNPLKQQAAETARMAEALRAQRRSIGTPQKRRKGKFKRRKKKGMGTRRIADEEAGGPEVELRPIQLGRGAKSNGAKLPEGWETTMHGGKEYFFNREKKLSQWHRPGTTPPTSGHRATIKDAAESNVL